MSQSQAVCLLVQITMTQGERHGSLLHQGDCLWLEELDAIHLTIVQLSDNELGQVSYCAEHSSTTNCRNVG